MLFIGAGKAEAQWVVHDPGHTFLNSTEWYTNVKKWIEQIKEMEAAQKLREGLQNIDRMKELKCLLICWMTLPVLVRTTAFI